MAEKSDCPDLEPVKDKRISEGGAAEPETTLNDIIDKKNTQFNGSVLNPSTSGRRDEVWEARRRFNNLRRREKAKVSHKARVEAARVAQEALEASMSAEQWAEWREAQEAERVQRIAAEAAQAERLAAALAAGGPGAGSASVLRIVIDCSFAPESPPKELRSLCKQIENSSAINKRYPRPACLTLASWGEPLASVAAPCGAAGWRLAKLVEGPAEAFGAQAVVVLSPDAAEPLLDLDSERRVYVIGGIVDRTHRKGLTLKYAEARQVECRRLPVAEHAEQLGLGKGTRKCPVLNIDDVVKALIIYHDTRDWVRALDAAIPIRKRKPQTASSRGPAVVPLGPGPGAGAGSCISESSEGKEEDPDPVGSECHGQGEASVRDTLSS
ncbi:hypothetical protein VaNZ11_005193 [Volvox africanus]|uniref:tRNA (guanine(9)-N(1))-methyltransferase n=1 Tax=Volvox africanus TaxID=51714 RepID=A0ABQ5RZA5_9CHLO|nr:hypothetical protein VaNZ11_005193 [Volvox africanus]